MKPAIPVLMSEIKLLERPVDIIKHVLNAYTRHPKNITDTYTDDEISFRWDDAQNGSNPDVMRSVVQSNLRKVLIKYFPTASIVNVDVSTEDLTDNDGRYNIIIDITVVIDGSSYSIGNKYVIKKDGYLDLLPD